MSEHLREFNPPTRVLMGAGPSNVSPRVLRAMAAPLLGHLDTDFVQIMDEIRGMLKQLFRTENELTLPVSGTGTAGMEASLINVLEPGDVAVVAVNGFFGQRMAEIASRCGATPVVVEIPWGKPVDPAVVKRELAKHRKVKAVAMVHAETSTGVLSPLADIASMAHSYDALLVVDAVTSLGGVEVAVDDWGLDVCFSGTQKCLGCPPGLAPITMGPRARKAIQARRTPTTSFYLDLSWLSNYWSTQRLYHHTAPISMIYGIREALRMLFEEGLENRIHRHARNARALRAGLEALGLKLFAQEGYRLDTLTTVYIPDGIEDEELRRALVKESNIEIGGGLGDQRGKIWRIGLMGENATSANVLAFLSALELVLARRGFELPIGEGVAAAQRALATG